MRGRSSYCGSQLSLVVMGSQTDLMTGRLGTIAGLYFSNRPHPWQQRIIAPSHVLRKVCCIHRNVEFVPECTESGVVGELDLRGGSALPIVNARIVGILELWS